MKVRDLRALLETCHSDDQVMVFLGEDVDTRKVTGIWVKEDHVELVARGKRA